MNAPLYTTEILRLAASLSDAQVEREDGSAELRSPTCGSRVRTAVQVGDDGTVLAVSQQVNACAFGQASAAILQQGAVGRASDEVENAVAEIAVWLAGSEMAPAWPGITALAPACSRTGRHGAILLPFRTLAAALAAASNRHPGRDIPPAP